MLISRIAFTFIFCAGFICGSAQNSELDSLNNILKGKIHDTTRAQTLMQLTEIYAATNLDTVIPLCEKALAIAEIGLASEDPKVQRAFRMVKVQAYTNTGYVYSMKDEVVQALDFYAKSKAELDQLNDKQGLADYYISVGFIYRNQGDLQRAIEYYQNSYELQMEIGDKFGAASSLNNIAVIYNDQKDTAKAMEYFKKALQMYRDAGDNLHETELQHSAKLGEGTALNNIAALFEKQHDTARALRYYNDALAVRRDAGDIRGIGSTLNNIGALYSNQGDLARALRYYAEALSVREGAKDKRGVAMTLNNIATVNMKLGNADSAITKAQRALSIGEQIGYPDVIAASSKILSEAYASLGHYEDAYRMHVLFKEMTDSMYNDATKKAVFKQQMKYNIAQHDAELKTAQDVKDAQAAEAQEKQTTIIYVVSGALLVMIVLALFILKGYREKQKANEIILAQKAEADKSKHIIEEKNKDILDSLNYAKRIQRAKLPDREDIQKLLPESFILFQPKDIVSGDFYFFCQQGKYMFLAAADCTGHGVPGALMSMIGYEKLSEAIAMSDDVSRILKLANQGIKASLRQTDSEDSTRDGMDIALCRIDLQTNTIQYAGANRPLWCIRRGEQEVHEIKATKMALGGYTHSMADFTRHEITLEDGDTIYLFSDGYADLFNGETGKKLTTKKLKQILLEIQNKDLHEQEVYLADFAKNWSQDTEQVDDILVIGMRL
jgi:serine phosphatase RsbU (regulator of sigma subunit)/Tfp pilus assembly protein PilF